MTALQIVVLGLVQGFTEFLPISSSAHLILINRGLGFADEGLIFDVAAHLGTLVAVLVYFSRDLWAMATNQPLADFSGVSGWRMVLWLIWATIPLGLVGILFADPIEAHLRTTLVIAIATIVFGLLLGWSDRRPGHRLLELRIVIIMGLAQVLALIPGTSRSGITMTAGLLCGLPRQTAARFSFLMAIPAIGAAATFGLRELLTAPEATRQDVLAAGVIAAIAFIAAIATIHLFIRLIGRIGMLPFVIYRVALGGALLLFI